MFVFILSNIALSFPSRERYICLLFEELLNKKVQCKAGSVNPKPHSISKALLLQELLLTKKGFVAEFSFCVPRAARNNVAYGLIFQTVLDYSRQNRDRLLQDILILKELSNNCLYMIKYQ
jgi:hypothetical protein